MLEFLQNYWQILVAGLIVIIGVVSLVILTRKPKDQVVEKQETEEPVESAVESEEVEPEEEVEEVQEEEEQVAPVVERKPRKRPARPKKVEKDEIVEEPIAEEVEEPVQEAEVVEESQVAEEGEVEESETASAETAPKAKQAVYHVIYDKEAKMWSIRKNNAKRPSKKARTKEEAIAIAKQLCETNNAKLRVHKKDGKFQKNVNAKI